MPSLIELGLGVRSHLTGLVPPYLTDLVAAKAEQEHGRIPESVASVLAERLAADLAALQARLDEVEQNSGLPDRASAEPALHDLLIRVRTQE